MAKSVLHPLGMSSELLEDLSYLNWKCHVTYLLLQVTYLAPHVCPYWLVYASVTWDVYFEAGHGSLVPFLPSSVPVEKSCEKMS